MRAKEVKEVKAEGARSGAAGKVIAEEGSSRSEASTGVRVRMPAG